MCSYEGYDLEDIVLSIHGCVVDDEYFGNPYWSLYVDRPILNREQLDKLTSFYEDQRNRIEYFIRDYDYETHMCDYKHYEDDLIDLIPKKMIDDANKYLDSIRVNLKKTKGLFQNDDRIDRDNGYGEVE